MQPIASYFSASLQCQFKAALPHLRKRLAVTPFSKRDAKFGVAGETLRVFRKCRNRPSMVYRTWAKEVCEDLDPLLLAKHLKSRAAFESWHSSLVQNLCMRWKNRQGRVLSVAHRYKLIDLLVKWLSAHDFGVPEVTQGFERYAHCALDRQTLSKLNECLSLALPLKTPFMGDIRAEQTYSFCQDLIAEFTASCGGTPLLFDYFAWRPGGLNNTGSPPEDDESGT